MATNTTVAALTALVSRYPFRNTVQIVNNQLVDAQYPGTDVKRLIFVTDRVK